MVGTQHHGQDDQEQDLHVSQSGTNGDGNGVSWLLFEDLSLEKRMLVVCMAVFHELARSGIPGVGFP